MTSIVAGDHAVVIGGSIAGLLAARVLARRFVAVTVLEKDALPIMLPVSPKASHPKHAVLGKDAALKRVTLKFCMKKDLARC